MNAGQAANARHLLEPDRVMRLRRWLFLLALVASNYTLLRPSPVDVVLAVCLLFSLRPAQRLSVHNLIFLGLIGAWMASFLISSYSLATDPDVAYQMWKISWAVSIGVCATLVAAHLDTASLEQFFHWYIAATVIAACLGIVGFALNIEELTWDGRAKALLDDPNMYSAFIMPGALASIYMIATGRKRARYYVALSLIIAGLVVAFSRVALVAFLIWACVYIFLLTGRNRGRALGYLLVALVIMTLVYVVFALTLDSFHEKLFDRLTVAKDYDLGHNGRYSRYALSIPLILGHPLGLGLLVFERMFPEPIHNIVLSSFMNYGWVAGLAFVLLLMSSVMIAWANFKASGNRLFILVLFCWASIMTCAFVHEAERWRMMWLYTGLLCGLHHRNFITAPGRFVATRPSRNIIAEAAVRAGARVA